VLSSFDIFGHWAPACGAMNMGKTGWGLIILGVYLILVVVLARRYWTSLFGHANPAIAVVIMLPAVGFYARLVWRLGWGIHKLKQPTRQP
jgi:hypothetical protein